MSDIDFDELDKAVNTLMSDVPKVELPNDDIKTLTINSTLNDESRPSLTKLDATLTEVNGPATKPVDAPAAVSVPPRAAAPSLATRRGGRFMDVVHPSSDMKTASNTITPSSRQGVTIEPTGKLLPEKSVDQSDIVSVDKGIAPESYKDLTVSDVSIDAKSDDSASAERDIPANDWPDPLEMSGYTPDQPVKSVEPKAEAPTVASIDQTEKDDEIASSPLINNTFDMEDTQPLNSPFIPDAKVEKRPLGGAPVEEPGHAPVLGVLATNDFTDGQHPGDQLPVTPADIEVQLPPELQSDLMAIETDGDTFSTKTPEKDGTSSVSKSEAKLPDDVPVRADAVEAAKPAATVAATAVGPTSIPQQYHEEPSTSDEPNGSIYDTDSYHQPLAHPAKTKSGWLWVIWILLLLIVGGGGAMALYFMDII
ncbi:MAG: hypothetical protein JWM07_481 [Candidatus Saccharibacteria bacterium]|nr:hypothetical protein [Candidatus Saccharibacteria bacterium]